MKENSIVDKLGIEPCYYEHFGNDCMGSPARLVESDDIKHVKNTAFELLWALIKSTIELEQDIKDIGGCDHTVGHCICELVKLVGKNIETIREADPQHRTWERIKEL